MKRLLALTVLAATIGPAALSGAVQAQQSAPQTVLHARTATELAQLCESRPTDAPSTARLNFCFGYAQATLDAEARQGGGKRFYCVPTPSPTREATMREFAAWVRTTPAAANANPQEAVVRFFTQRFPCKT